jgi:hypothetical protein
MKSSPQFTFFQLGLYLKDHFEPPVEQSLQSKIRLANNYQAQVHVEEHPFFAAAGMNGLCQQARGSAEWRIR